jgi:hypothetical protein
MGATFVQIGATRDGLDPYLDSAHGRRMTAVLVETPAYLCWRRNAGRRAFDAEIPVERPEKPEQVRTALRDAGLAPSLVLTGFERYAVSGFGVAALMGTASRPGHGEPFVPPDKIEQRNAVSAKAPHVLQPRYMSYLTGRGNGSASRAVPTAGTGFPRLTWPVVVKPADGGGGLGVFRVRGPEQLAAASASIAATANYGGGAFRGVLIEEQVRGVEYSVQGIAWHGKVTVLGVCEKLVTVDHALAGLDGFREAAHIFVLGTAGLPDLTSFAQSCLDAVGYRDGPFHLDLMRTERGPVFLEMGFRLSGAALVDLIKSATGQNWADWVFACYLGERPPASDPEGKQPAKVVGQAIALTEAELGAAERARSGGLDVEVRRFPARLGRGSEHRPELASDQIRHGDAVGRIRVTADRPDIVRTMLRGFLSDREEV